MKHYLLNHQPQKGLQAACAQQGQAPTCNARGKGHTSASPKTLTRILLVLLTMFLLPGAAWGQDPTITVAGITPDATTGTITGDGITSGTVSFDASTNTLTLDNARVNGTVTTSLTKLNVHLKGHSVFYVQTDGSNYYYLFNGGQTLNLNYSAESIGDVLEGIGTTNDYKLESSKTSTTTTTYDGPSGSWFDRYSQLDSKCYCKVSKPYLWVVDDEVDKSNISNFTTEIDGFSFDGDQSLTIKKIVHEDNGDFIVKSNLAVLDVYIADDIRYNLKVTKDGETVQSTGKVFVYTGTDDSSTLTLNIAEGKTLRALWSIGTKYTGSTNWICEGFNITNYYTELSSAIDNNVIYAEEAQVSGEYSISFSHVELYDLSVAGNRVNSINAADILGDQSSSVSFTPAEGTNPATLTLNKATLTVSTDGGAAIESSLDNLIVYLVGDNTVQAQAGSQNITSFYAFKGNSNNTITFQTNVQEPGNINIQGLVSEQSVFNAVDPAYQKGLGLTRNGNNFEIGVIKYGLTIGETVVTALNANDVLGDGTVSFSPAEVVSDQPGTGSNTPATLTLDGATLTAGIVTGMNMTIDLKGNNSITVNGGYALSVPNNESPTITFTSSSSPIGNLTLKSTASAVNGLVGGNINILYDTSKGIVPSFLVTTAADPTTANFTNSTEAVITNGTAYGLYIADVPVTNSNASGITGSGIKGTVTYTDATKTLTLNGAEITGNISSSSISELKVYLIGKNSITPTSDTTPFAYTGAVGTTSPQLSFESSDTDEGELTMNGDITTSGSGQNITLSSGGYSYSNTFGTGESVTTFGDWIIDYPDSKKRIYYNPHYGITVGNYEVTKKNKDMVTFLSGSDIKYLPEDQALLIPSNSTFADYTIKSHREELTIYVSGDCVSKSIIFESNSNFPATSGVLIIKKDPSSTASINKLTLNNTDGVITGFSNVTIDESLNLLTPATTPTWDATVTEAVFTDETLYDLWVEGIRVTSGNKDNVKGEYSTNVDDPITPSVVFDGNNKLTLTNASITVTDKNAIESGIENLTVNLVGGENIITCQGTNDVAFKAVGSGSKITFTTTSEYEAVSLYISGGISPIEGLDTDYENGLGFLYSSTDQRYSVETLETPEIKRTAETEDGITVALVLPSGDKYSSNTTMYYKITYSDSDETTGFSEYSNAFTMTKPGTVTAYLVPLGGQSANAVAKYFGYPDAPYTLAVGDEITPAIYPAINSNDGIGQSGASSGNEDIASFTYSDGVAKAIGIGNTTLTATFTAGDQPFTILNIDPEGQTPNEFTATFSVIVGGSLNEVFEGSNEFGSFYNTSETTYAVPEGMKAYVITGVNGDKVITTETTVLPPNTVVLMDKGEGKAFTYIPATSGSAPTGNLLKRATSDVAVNTSSKLFVLYNDEYVKATAGSPIPAGKNYLDLSGVTAAGTRGFYYIEGGDDGTTAIREVRSGEAGSEKTADGGWHDLQGRKLTTKPAKGLYIRNGKKVVVK